MSLEISGRLVKKMSEVTGQGRNGQWKKQEFVLETAEQYPKKICLSVWGDKVENLASFREGDYVKASINIESREYNERWYTEIRAWRLQTATAETSSNDNNNNNFEEHPQQFNNNSNSNNSGSGDVNGMSFSSETADDLPF